MHHDKLKICILAPDSYQAYVPGGNEIIGGVEFQSSTMAKALARNQNFDVSALVWKRKGRTVCKIDGVNIIPCIPDPNASFLYRNVTRTATMVTRTSRFPWISSTGFKPSLIWRLPLATIMQLYLNYTSTLSRPAQYNAQYAQIDGDIYLCFGMAAVTTDMIATGQKTGKKTILMISSDEEVSTRYLADSNEAPLGGESKLAWYQSLQHADAIVAQQVYQRDMLKQHFNRNAHVIFNPINLSCHATSPYQGLPKRYVLWVGRSDRNSKRPKLCIEVAQKCPNIQFVMVMNKRDVQVFDSIMADLPDNVTVIEQVPMADIESLFRKADCYLSTSMFEGFPNTFLQAGKYNIPIFSLKVDPNEMLSTHGGGVVANEDMTLLCDSLTKAWNDASYLHILGEKAHLYVQNYHDLDKNIEHITRVIISLTTDDSIKHARS